MKLLDFTKMLLTGVKIPQNKRAARAKYKTKPISGIANRLRSMEYGEKL